MQTRIRTIIKDLNKNTPWVLKDPRLCLTYPAWRIHLERPILVFVHRNPLDIAKSLHERNGIPIPTGLSLTNLYIKQLLEIPDISEHCSVSIDELFDGEPYEVVTNLYNDLVSAGVKRLKLPSKKEVDEYLDRDLLHHHISNPSASKNRDIALEKLLESIRQDCINGYNHIGIDPIEAALYSYDEINTIKKTHETALTEFIDSRRADSERLQSNLLSEIESRETKYQSRIISIEEKHQHHISELEEKHQHHTSELEEKHQHHISELEEKHQHHTSELEEKHQHHTSELEEKHQHHTSKLEEKHQHHTSKLEEKYLTENEAQKALYDSLFEEHKQAAERQSNELISRHSEALSSAHAKASKLTESNELLQQEHSEISELNALLQSKCMALGDRCDELVSKYNARIDDLNYLLDFIRKLDVHTARILESNSWRFFKGAIATYENIIYKNDIVDAQLQINTIHNYLDDCNPESVRESFNYQRFMSGIRLPDNDNNIVNYKDTYTKSQKLLLDAFIASSMKLDFMVSDQPLVSIIIVLFNRAELSLGCFQSIINTVEQPYEVIIVDNNSSDDTRILLERTCSAKILLNEENEGFLKAVNQAFKYVSGEYLLLINNDSLLMSNSIENALRVFQEEDHVGAVGGKIINLDGNLQEAGNIIWNDGSCLSYGRGASPLEPEFNFRRDVDYCSGAFLVTPTDLFLQMKGFDRLYEPAYYEETDYCMKLRDAGYRVVYEPTCQTLHYEYASSEGFDAVNHQLRKNQDKFFKKHQATLQAHSFPDFDNVTQARSNDFQSPRVLVIDDRVPHRHYGSGFPRANELLSSLANSNFQITFYPMNFPDEGDWSSIYSDIPRRVEVMRGYGVQRLDEFLTSRNGYYDAVIVSRPHNMSTYNDALRRLSGNFVSPPFIYDAEAIFINRERIKRSLSNERMDDIEYTNALRDEISLSHHASLIFVVSEHERDIFTQYSYRNTRVLGHVMEANKTPNLFSQRSDILFVGNLDYDESPNVDSVIWFVEKILPNIRSHSGLENTQLTLIGSNHSTKIQQMNYEGVKSLGAVNDLTDYYNSHRIFIAPTRFASGIPNKIHEASAHGVPCVITELLLDQLSWKHNQHALSSPTHNALAFAHNCVRLLTDEHLWSSIQDNVLQKVIEDCSPNKFTDTLRESLSEIIQINR